MLCINAVFSNFYPQSLYIDGSPYLSSIHLSPLKFLSYKNLHSLTKLTCLIKLQAWNTFMFSALMDSSRMTKEKKLSYCFTSYVDNKKGFFKSYRTAKVTLKSLYSKRYRRQRHGHYVNANNTE